MSLDDHLAEHRRLMRDDLEGQPVTAEMNNLRQTMRHRCSRLSPEDERWIRERLNAEQLDSDLSWFIGPILEFAHPLPNSLFEPLVRAGVYETNPSSNRYFVEPSVREYGFRRVAERLLRYLNDGTDFEKAGAVDAFYWALVLSRDPNEQFEELRQHICDKFLTEFVSNDDTQIRRCIIKLLSTKVSKYSPAIQHLVSVAIDIARNHPDDYIRHRIEVQLGNESSMKPFPDREK